MILSEMILEKKLGRKLKEGEKAFHLNGSRTDTRPDNMCVTSAKDGMILTQLAMQSRIRHLESVVNFLQLPATERT